MAEIIKETVTTQESSIPVQTTATVIDNSVAPEATDYKTVEYLIYFAFGILEALLIFRVILKLMGASLSSGFVNFVYGLTQIFVWPFEGIFRKAFTEGIETTSVLEPATLVAIIVYILVGWGVIHLVRVLSGKQQVE